MARTTARRSLQLTAEHKVATPVNWQQGEDVIIVGSVSDDEARETYPDGWESPRPYIRIRRGRAARIVRMSFEALKARQREAWGSAPWEPMAATFATIDDHLVARLAPRRGERWLDAGTGTGAVARRAALAGARVTGLDLAPVMMETARRLAAEERLAIRFEVGDAESLPYEDASFDVAASALGVFLAPDHAAVARELARVCRPGGRLGVVAWRRDTEAERMHAPFWGPPEPGAGDRRAWGREEYVAALLDPAFELEFEEGELRPTAASGEEMWRLFTSYDGAAKAQVDSLDRRRAEEYRRALIAHHERYRANGCISLPCRYLVSLGRRRGGSG